MKLSIIVPVYNVSKYLRRCLDSLVMNNRRDIEIIMVDDGSLDDSGAICDEYSRQYHNFHTIHKQNGGLSSARKAGFKQAKGKYIWFVDGDDFIEPDAVSTIVSTMDNDGSQLAYIGYNVYSDNHAYPQTFQYDQRIIKDSEIQELYIKPLFGLLPKERPNINAFLWQRIMVRTLISENFFVHENKYFAEDAVFDLNYINKVSAISLINVPLYNYVYNASSLSNKIRENAWEMRKNLCQFYSDYCSNHNISADDRLTSAKLAGLLYSIHNYTRIDYKTFRHYYKTIKKDSLFQELIHINPLSSTMRKQFRNFRLVHFLCKYLNSFTIYKFYRWRQTR